MKAADNIENWIKYEPKLEGISFNEVISCLENLI